METFFVPTENDFRRWIKEAVMECLEEHLKKDIPTADDQEIFLTRQEAAKILRVSLVTLTDWMRRGLPYHKQRRRVYFVKQEVLDYIRMNKLSSC